MLINSQSTGGTIKFVSSIDDNTSVVKIDNEEASFTNYNCNIVSGTNADIETSGTSSVIRAYKSKAINILGGSLVNEKYNSSKLGYDISISNSGNVVITGDAVLKAKTVNVLIYPTPAMSIFDCTLISTINSTSTPRIKYPTGTKVLNQYLSSDTRVFVNNSEKSSYYEYNVNTITDAELRFSTAECMFGHTEAEKITYDKGHIRVCSICNAFTGLSDHDMQLISDTATCSAEGRITQECASCYKKTVSTSPKKEHTLSSIPGKPSTCTETGLTDGEVCSVCGEIVTPQTEVPKAAHKPVTIKGKAASCTETGLTDGKKCSVCGEIVTPQAVIPKTAHKTSTTTTKATYAKKGKQVTKCTVCGTITETKELPKLKVSATEISKLTAPKKKQIKVTWKKNKKVTGYQIQIASNKKFSKDVTTVTIKKKSTTSNVFKGLKKNTKYYVRIKSYTVENGKKYYSSWSSIKSIKTKK